MTRASLTVIRFAFGLSRRGAWLFAIEMQARGITRFCLRPPSPGAL